MSDIREDVAKAIAQPLADSLADPDWPVEKLLQDSAWGELFYPEADLAIAAATPHIRQALFDELIAAAGVTFDGAVYFCEDGWVSIERWLTSHKERDSATQG